MPISYVAWQPPIKPFNQLQERKDYNTWFVIFIDLSLFFESFQEEMMLVNGTEAN
jgi:hypothetical protein